MLTVENAVEVNADLAKKWLGENTHNRNIRKVHVQVLAKDMTEGRWEFTGDPIRFDANGTLMDGQHRLEALILADELDPGFTIKLLVVKINTGAQGKIDRVAPRSVSDTLKFMGYSHCGQLAAMSKLLILFEDNKLLSNQAMSSARQVEWIEDHPGVQEFIISFSDTKNFPGAFPSTIHASLWLMHQIDADATVEFAEGLLTQADLALGDPRLALYKKCTSMKLKNRNNKNFEWMGLMVETWNRWRKNEKIVNLQDPKAKNWKGTNFPKPI